MPQSPRTYLTQPNLEEPGSQSATGTQGLSRNPQGPHNLVDPTPENPRYPNPGFQSETLSAATSSGTALLGFETRERGLSRSNPRIPSGSRAVAESIPRAQVAPVRHGNVTVGAAASYVDDVGYIGLPSGAPDLSPVEHFVDANDDLAGEEFERHTSEEDGVARSHLITDAVDPVIAPEVRADVDEADYREGREPLRLCIYPGWLLRVPPRESWPRCPDWGGYEALWHQGIPRNVTRDFYHVDYRRGVLVRMHAAPRRRMFLPVASTLPPGLRWQNLSGRRRTFAKYADPVLLSIREDNLTDPSPQRQLVRRWTGRTEFELCDVPWREQ